MSATVCGVFDGFARQGARGMPYGHSMPETVGLRGAERRERLHFPILRSPTMARARLNVPTHTTACQVQTGRLRIPPCFTMQAGIVRGRDPVSIEAQMTLNDEETWSGVESVGGMCMSGATSAQREKRRHQP